MELIHKQKGSKYLTVALRDDEGNTANRPMHVVMTTAFLGPKPKDVNGFHTTSIIANHLDGDKWNNAKGNLEWTDHSGNIIHAYKTGLRSDNKPIIAWNIETNEKTEYYSLAECARNFKVSTERIWRNLRATDNIYFDKFVFRLKEDTRPWPIYDKSHIGKHVNGTSKRVKAVKLDNDLIVISESASEMARALGMKMATVAAAARNYKAGNGTGISNGYKFEYV